MLRLFKFIGIILLLTLAIGTGNILVTQGNIQFLWQFFWLGFVIWLWGYIILLRLSDKVEAEYMKDPNYYSQRQHLDQLKLAAISALLAITFFYTSISWIFKDDVFLSAIVLVVTFLVSFQVQGVILRKIRKNTQ
jgi:hypothetical protein